MTMPEGTPPVTVRLPQSERLDRIAAAVDRLVGWLARHWLALFNSIVGLFVALPFLAPTLMNLGATAGCETCRQAGGLIYLLYRPTCHQLPERSWFLFGPQEVYSVAELEAAGSLPPGQNILQRQLLRFNGNPAVGFKVALCERDIAIYGAMLMSGLAFAALRGRLRRARDSLPKLPLWAYALLAAPMAVDGGTQLVGLRESDWLIRLVTGGLFGAVTVWLAYPYVQEAMDAAAKAAKSQGANWTKTAA